MSTLELRIFRPFGANYYGEDVLRAPECCSDAYFAELTAHGFNAVWFRGVLRQLVQAAPYPDMGDGAHEQRLAALRLVVDRAARHGVKVLLYLNEPLGFPAGAPFLQAHPEVVGGTGISPMDEWYDTRALCTSEPRVREWLRNAAAALFRAVPGLGGWILITASEHHTHCYSHLGWHGKIDCPRCLQRSASAVTAEVIRLLRDGTREASREAACIAWNWSWEQLAPDPQPEIFAALPADVGLLLDWERGGWQTLPDGRQNWMDEYSLSYIGPTERFVALRDEARRRGLQVLAKFQVGTTHELATVPNLPLIDNLYEKLAHAEALGLTGFLGTWNFGNSFSFNTAAVARFMRDPERPGPRVFCTRLAADYFPGANAAGVAEAVARFSMAMRCYPFSAQLLYYGPMNHALVYPLTLAPLTRKSPGRTWVMDERGDDFSQALQPPWTMDEVIAAFSAMARDWAAGVTVFTEALRGCTHPHAAAELRSATLAGLCFRSTANVLKTYLLRRDRRADCATTFQALVRDELEVLEQALPLVEADPRLGFHAECQAYMFTAEGIRGKLAALRQAAVAPSCTG